MSGLNELFGQSGPSAILFDLDGTLVDSVPDIGAAIDRMLVEVGRKPAGIERVRSWVGNGSPVLVERALANESLSVEELGRRQGRRSDVEQQEAQRAYEIFLKCYAGRVADLSDLYPGVVESLDAFSGRSIPMAVVTNKPHRFTEPLLGEMGIRHYFQLIISGDTLDKKKPHPLPITHAADYFGNATRDILMVGDSVTDVDAARAAGCKIACVTYGYNYGVSIYDAEPDLVVDSLQQLI